jgi:hypothetical protein
VNELEVIRRECEALRDPDEATIAAARAALHREIESWTDGEQPRPRGRRLRRPLAAAASLAVLITAVLVLVIPAKQNPIGVKIAAAAADALNPSNGDIVHAASRTVSVTRSKTGGKTTTSTTIDEWWAAGGPPYARRDRYAYAYANAKGAFTILTTPCGQISYDQAANLFSVSPRAEPVQTVQDDPAAAYRDAYRHGRVHYRGKTTFRGIPAFTLSVTQYGAVDTLIVRRDNDYPLKTVSRRETARSVSTYVTTYSTFEHIRHSPSSERLLQLPQRAGAFFVLLPPTAPTAGSCKRFGNRQSLIRRSATP